MRDLIGMTEGVEQGLGLGLGHFAVALGSREKLDGLLNHSHDS